MKKRLKAPQKGRKSRTGARPRCSRRRLCRTPAARARRPHSTTDPACRRRTTGTTGAGRRSPTSRTCCRIFTHVSRSLLRAPAALPLFSAGSSTISDVSDSQPPDVTHNTAQGGRRTAADRVNRYASSASDDTMGTGTGRWKVSAKIQQLLNTLKRPKRRPLPEFYEDDDIELEIAANPKDPNAPKPEGRDRFSQQFEWRHDVVKSMFSRLRRSSVFTRRTCAYNELSRNFIRLAVRKSSPAIVVCSEMAKVPKSSFLIYNRYGPGGGFHLLLVQCHLKSIYTVIMVFNFGEQ